MYREVKGEAGEEKSNFNVQTWIDVRVFADLCRFKKTLGGGHTIAEVSRWCMEVVHRQVAGNMVDSFASVTEAISYLREEGISVRQLDGDRRSRRRIGDAFVLEERYIEEHGSLERLKQKMDTQKVLVKELGSKEAVDRFTQKAMKIFDSLPDEIPTEVATDDTDNAIQRAKIAEDRAKDEQARMREFIASLSKDKQ
jgi:hypothetical protein